MQTRPEHFFQVLAAGTVSTNNHLRRLHNFALAMAWLPWPVLAPQQWPAIRYCDMRGVTREEHDVILTAEQDPDWNLTAPASLPGP